MKVGRLIIGSRPLKERPCNANICSISHLIFMAEFELPHDCLLNLMAVTNPV